MQISDSAPLPGTFFLMFLHIFVFAGFYEHVPAPKAYQNHGDPFLGDVPSAFLLLFNIIVSDLH